MCSSDDDSSSIPVDETSGLHKIQEIANDTHTIELFSSTGSLVQGYNHVSLRIKDKKTSDYITDAKLEWTPLMHMTMMKHSCPRTAVTKAAGKKTVYEGGIIFQKSVALTEEDTPETVAEKIHELEQKYFPEIISRLLEA